MLITNTKEIAVDGLKMAIFGPSGAGKTTLAGTLDGSTLIISSEAGLRPLQGKVIDVIDISRGPVDKDTGKPTVLTDPAARLQKVSETFKWIHAGCPDKNGKPGKRYDNLFTDSLTEISEIVSQKLNKDFPDRKDSFPMWAEYGKIMRSIVKNFRDLPMNVFMVALSKPDKDDTGKRFIGFDIAGSIGDRLPQFFDVVAYLAVEEDGKRFLITRATPTINCKDRSGNLDAKEVPDLGIITQKFLKTKKEEVK